MTETLGVYRLDPEGKVVLYPSSRRLFVGPDLVPYGEASEEKVSKVIYFPKRPETFQK